MDTVEVWGRDTHPHSQSLRNPEYSHTELPCSSRVTTTNEFLWWEIGRTDPGPLMRTGDRRRPSVTDTDNRPLFWCKPWERFSTHSPSDHGTGRGTVSSDNGVDSIKRTVIRTLGVIFSRSLTTRLCPGSGVRTQTSDPRPEGILRGKILFLFWIMSNGPP